MLAIYAAMMIVAMWLLYGLLKELSGESSKIGILGWLCMAAVFIMFAFPVTGALVPDGPVCWFFQKWGNIFIGYLMYFFGVLLLVRIVQLPFRIARRIRKDDSRRPSRKAAAVLAAVLLAGTVLINVCGTYTAHNVRTTGYEISKELIGQDEPLRIVMIGDLHIGVNSTPQLYIDMVDAVNAAEPDLVLVAGDIVTSSFGAMRDPDVYSGILSGLNPKYGTYVVYGNHDVDEPLLGGFTFIGRDNALRNPAMPGFLENCGWTLLTDEVARIDELNGLCIAGRRDESRPGEGLKERASLSDLLSETDADEPIILLEHEPYDFDTMGDLGVDFAVSGHTHDGQIFPGNILSRIMSPQSYGFKEWGKAQAVVTSGVGYYGPPIRFGTISEITVIDAK